MLDFANEILRGLFALLAIPIGGSIELRSRLRVKLNFSGVSHGPAPYARLVTSAHGFVLTVPAFSSYKSSDLPLPFEFRCFIDGVLVKAGWQRTRECRTSFEGQSYGLFKQLPNLFRRTVILRRTPPIR